MSWEIVPESASRVREQRFPWWILLTVGILVVAVGVGLLIWPFIAAQWMLALLFGAALIANGLALLAGGRGGAAIFGGLVLVATGALAILFSEFTAAALVTFTAIAFISIGAIWLVAALSFGARASAAAYAPPVLLVLAGIIALVFPSWALVFIAVVAGLITLVIGASLIWGAIALRNAKITRFTV